MRQLRDALTSLLRSPASSLLCVLALALALSVNIAAFSLINVVWFAELPLPRPEQVRYVYHGATDEPRPFSLETLNGMIEPLGAVASRSAA